MTPAASDSPDEPIARLEDALHRIRQWCDVYAYPLDLFPKPDLEAIRKQIPRRAVLSAP